MEILIKTQDQGSEGKGKEIVDDEVVSLVRKGGSGGLGVGSHPGLGGRMTTLPIVVSTKVRAQEEVDSYRALVGKQYMDGLLPVEVNPLVWWKEHDPNFPYLSQITRRYLSMSSIRS